MEEIVSKKEPTERLLVAHFGNGDEDDQSMISEYAKRFGEIGEITILPGISYGHLQMKDVETAQRLMGDLDADNVKVLQ